MPEAARCIERGAAADPDCPPRPARCWVALECGLSRTFVRSGESLRWTACPDRRSRREWRGPALKQRGSAGFSSDISWAAHVANAAPHSLAKFACGAFADIGFAS